MGLIGTSNFGVGLLYLAVFAGSAPHRSSLLALNLTGLLISLALVATAGLLSRTPSALRFLIGSAFVTFPMGATIAALDGGTGSPLGVGVLIPMPLIALGTPVRVAAPLLAGISGLYVGVAVLVGAPSGWHVATSLVIMLGTSAVCAARGRAAARQRSLLTRLSRVDPLTELVNRRGFEERFLAALADAGRTGAPLSLLVIDLDGFKRVNDTLGHAAGDELLSWTAATLRATTRDTDVIGRLGGDEFVVLLPATGAAESRANADRLSAALAERTRISVGTAVLGEHGPDFDSLYTHADAELYVGKAERRSRPTLPTPLDEAAPVSSSRRRR
jgi:diguanylate cyclase (GGDEF)-like protein